MRGNFKDGKFHEAGNRAPKVSVTPGNACRAVRPGEAGGGDRHLTQAFRKGGDRRIAAGVACPALRVKGPL